jgi:AAA domain
VASAHFPDVLDWALAYEANDEEYVERTWNSIHDSAVGWRWLAAHARAGGFMGDVDADFDDAPPEWQPRGPGPQPILKKLPRLCTLADLDEQMGAHDFVEDFLCEGQLSLWYGAPGDGKTFTAIDLALRVSLGWQWNGRNVDQRAVLFIAGEGGGAITKRMRAFLKEHPEAADARFGFISEMPDFRDGRALLHSPNWYAKRKRPWALASASLLLTL